MTAIEESVDSKQISTRWSFRRKFWLFGVGLPVLLMIVLFALAVFLPKPLNPTEQQLLGRWVVVDPLDMKGNTINFEETYFSAPAYDVHLWEADENSVDLTRLDDRASLERQIYWTRLKQHLGISTIDEDAIIESLSEDELKIRWCPSCPIVIYRRAGSHQP